jgi:hypothetical protein
LNWIFLFPATTVRANPFLWNFPLEIFLRIQRPDDVSISKGMDSYEFPVFHLRSKGGLKLKVRVREVRYELSQAARLVKDTRLFISNVTSAVI